MPRSGTTSIETLCSRAWRWIIWIGTTLALVLYPTVTSAGMIRLAWDEVSDQDLAGYRVYYGTQPGLYTQTAMVGRQTTIDLTNLQDCTVYYLAVRAYDSNGNESLGYSNEISGMSAPEPSSITPSSAKQSTANLNVTIRGNNFDPQATPDLGPDIIVNSYSADSCGQITANITIENAARINNPPALPRLIQVVNSGGPRGKKSGAFTVTFNEVRADIDRSGRVMGRDFLYWRNAFGSVFGEPAYDIDTDLNGDGLVDGADLSLLSVWHGSIFF